MTAQTQGPCRAIRHSVCLSSLRRIFRNTLNGSGCPSRESEGDFHTPPTPPLPAYHCRLLRSGGVGDGEGPGTPLWPDVASGYKHLAQWANKFAKSHSGSQWALKVQWEVNHHSSNSEHRNTLPGVQCTVSQAAFTKISWKLHIKIILFMPGTVFSCKSVKMSSLSYF